MNDVAKLRYSAAKIHQDCCFMNEFRSLFAHDVDTEHASFENAKETPMVSDEEVIRIVQSYPAERRYALAAMQDMQQRGLL